MTCLSSHEQCGVNWLTRNSQALNGHLLHAGLTLSLVGHHYWQHTVVASTPASHYRGPRFVLLFRLPLAH
jgi:hypothetical protein